MFSSRKNFFSNLIIFLLIFKKETIKQNSRKNCNKMSDKRLIQRQIRLRWWFRIYNMFFKTM